MFLGVTKDVIGHSFSEGMCVLIGTCVWEPVCTKVRRALGVIQQKPYPLAFDSVSHLAWSVSVKLAWLAFKLQGPTEALELQAHSITPSFCEKVLGIHTQAPMLSRQAVYCLSHLQASRAVIHHLAASCMLNFLHLDSLISTVLFIDVLTPKLTNSLKKYV